MRVVIGEDEALMREGLVHVLQDARIEVVGVTGEDQTQFARRRVPDPDRPILAGRGEGIAVRRKCGDRKSVV